jgi:lysozyme family protein
MARSSYEESLRRLLAHEGGYTNHPSDPGGPTNFGITIHDYRKFVKPSATAADVRSMKVAEAKSIYRAKYWDAQRCDDLPAGIDDSLFDYGVNSGIGRSGKVLRRIVGLADNTSVINDEVLKAVARRDSKAIINAINDERLRFLKGLKTWPVFGTGWGRRVSEVRAFSLKLASESIAAQEPAPRAATSTAAPAKGVVPQPKALKDTLSKVVPIGGAAGGLSFWDWIAVHPFETAAIALLATVMVVAGVQALSRWHRARQEAPTPNLIPVAV